MARSKDPQEEVHFDGVEYLARSQKAVYVDFGEGNKQWIPLSQIIDEGDNDITMTLWIAQQKGLA